MDRRDILRTLGAVGALSTPAAMLAQQEGHVHGAAAHQTLVTAASDCVVKGETCVAHCQQILATGDKTLALCSRTANEMVVICGALRSLAIQEAPSIPRLAAVALDVCGRCEAECRKHEKVHLQCKECADACAACAADCRKLTSA